ncbi:peroxisome biogenesis protein 22-like isoform X2 [Momordica charantia]|uniref:Peroxisome biogenesis protein 22-like isoform X2 n=1 Tax=Momordica charantia TaxID=3673 RepID=A0A6J1C2P4_MOMCH|nr:peroxisome biogenesis protein 22-like isoform X2 [Momordica charantia]
MAGSSSKEELVQLIKRFGSNLSVKLSSLFSILFQSRNLRSLSAIAGFALAVIFSWKLLKPPSGHHRRQPKRQTSATSNSDSTTSSQLITSRTCSPSDDSGAQNFDNELYQPVKPTLGQIVRQKLGGGRKVTCRLLGIILEEHSPEELQNEATVRSSVVDVLLEITKHCDLYLMERVLDEDSERKVIMALEGAGVFTSGGLIKDKVLFCSTENGRTSFVRQLEPDWHIDSDPEIVSQLARFINCQLHISQVKPPDRTSSNVLSSASLEQFFLSS